MRVALESVFKPKWTPKYVIEPAHYIEVSLIDAPVDLYAGRQLEDVCVSR